MKYRTGNKKKKRRPGRSTSHLNKRRECHPLPKNKNDVEAREAYRNKMREQVASTFNDVINLSKGVGWSTQFFKMIRSHVRPVKTLAEIKATLQRAWWIEEEDLRQYLCECIVRHRIRHKRWTVQRPLILFFLLCIHARNYLVFKEHVFHRLNGWEELYLNEQQAQQEKLQLEYLPSTLPLVLGTDTDVENAKLVNNFSLIDRYMMHLYYMEEMTSDVIGANILQTYGRKVRRIIDVLDKKMEVCYGKKITKRYSSGDVAEI